MPSPAPSVRSPLEIRTLVAADLRVRDGGAGGGSAGTIAGCACYTGVETELEPGLYESFLPSAFDARMWTNPSARDVKALLHHDGARPLASVKNGTLSLTADRRGLWFEARLPDSPLGHEVYASVQRGDLNGASFAFTVPEGGAVWERRAGLAVRHVRRLSLFEVSVTSIGRQQEAFTTVVEQRTLEQGRALRAELAASSPTLRAAKARLEIVQARILLSEAMAPDGTRRPTAATERRRKTLHDR